MVSDVATKAEPPAEPAAADGRSRRLGLIGWGLALAAVLVGLAGGLLETSVELPLRLTLGILGLLVAGSAVSLRPRDQWTLAIAAVTAVTASVGLPPEWDSARLVAAILAGLAVCAALILFLPPVGRRAAISLVVLFHFGGILSAVTNPPTGGARPWLTDQIWTCVYRPYLQFTYLNNAYHFYSPEPGPANLLWFCLEYENADGKLRHVWKEIPRRPEDVKDPLALEYFRRLSLTEQTNQIQPVLRVPDEIKRRRVSPAGVGFRIPLFHPNLPPEDQQFRMPLENARRLILPSYARWIASSNPSDRPGETLVSVRIYRAEHRIMLPNFYADPKKPSPYDPTTYAPYFLGEFDKNGDLRDPYDPMLYWLVPLLKDPAPISNRTFGVGPPTRRKPHWKFGNADGGGFVFKDYVTLHALYNSTGGKCMATGEGCEEE